MGGYIRKCTDIWCNRLKILNMFENCRLSQIVLLHKLVNLARKKMKINCDTSSQTEQDERLAAWKPAFGLKTCSNKLFKLWRHILRTMILLVRTFHFKHSKIKYKRNTPPPTKSFYFQFWQRICLFSETLKMAVQYLIYRIWLLQINCFVFHLLITWKIICKSIYNIWVSASYFLHQLSQNIIMLCFSFCACNTLLNLTVK